MFSHAICPMTEQQIFGEYLVKETVYIRTSLHVCIHTCTLLMHLQYRLTYAHFYVCTYIQISIHVCIYTYSGVFREFYGFKPLFEANDLLDKVYN